MVFSLKKIVLKLEFWCVIVKKIGLMLLLGCVIKSNCDCGHSSQVICVAVVVEVVQISFCSSLINNTNTKDSGFVL